MQYEMQGTRNAKHNDVLLHYHRCRYRSCYFGVMPLQARYWYQTVVNTHIRAPTHPQTSPTLSISPVCFWFDSLRFFRQFLFINTNTHANKYPSSVLLYDTLFAFAPCPYVYASDYAAGSAIQVC
jgi:hypothetical protein